MRRIIIFAALTLFIVSVFAQDVTLSSATSKFDEGVKAYQTGNLEEALTPFQDAADMLNQLLQGVLSPEDEAYTKYFYATAQYYVARIRKDGSMFESASKTFNEAAGAFKGIETVGEEYVRSKYLRAMCSFRLYQLATTERNQAKMLDQAIGDFTDFISDEDVQKNAKDFPDYIDNSNYYIGYCKYMLGYLKSFNPAQYSSAKKLYDEALNSFDEAKKASDERMSLAASYMEAGTHYLIARLYMRVSENDWGKTYKLSSKARNAAVEEELNASIDELGKMISAAGTQKDLQLMGKVSKLIDMVTLGSVGEKDKLNDAMGQMTDMRDNAKYGGEMLIRIADASLLNYLIFNGAQKTVLNNMGRIASKIPDALYWAGWVQYIQGDYSDANGKFGSFASKVESDRSTRAKELLADAKFRQAECLFWLGVKQGNLALLTQADNIYTALSNPQGKYYELLTKDTRDIVSIRQFLIGIESSLGKEKGVGVLDGAMALAGLQLPRDAEKYLSVGKYFLQKGIETAAEERQTAVRFATYAFDKVINAGVSGDIKNRARFMKGVALVKLAAAQEKSEATKTVSDAEAVLNQCTSPYKDEAKYVVGRGYFNINSYDKATSILQSLKGKGHIRAAYTYAIIQEEKKNNSAAAKALGQIKATIKDRTNYLYQKADLELSKIPGGASQASGASSLPKFKEPPMTYENLVDEEQERARKKAEAKYIWQRSSRFKDVPDIDDLIPDKPPETSVSLEIAIEPSGGEENILIDGKEGLANLVETSIYKLTLNRGTHKVVVKKKGFYMLTKDIKVSKSERITLTLNKAVRYTKTGELSGTKNALAVATDSNNIFVADAKKQMIVQFDKKGGKIAAFKYGDLDIGSVAGMALDEDLLIITDPEKNQVVAVTISAEAEEETTAEEGSSSDISDTSDTTSGAEESKDTSKTTSTAAATSKKKIKKTIIAYSGETYGSAPLSRPAGIAVSGGKYFIVDAGNARVLVFEGSSFRKEIGTEKLVHPIDVSVGGDLLYVADIGLREIVQFTVAGEFKNEFELSQQTQPDGVYVSPEGFVFVSDFVLSNIIKYTADMKPLSVAATDVVAPRSISQIGSGPEAVVYVADNAGLTLLKGSWDNIYTPE